jgi:uncharacterized protein YndB with AHSA1/START domain
MQDTDISLIRSLRVTPAVVWRAWTEPSELARWWWPARFQTQYEVDLRAGGQYRFTTAEVPEMGVLELTGTFRVVEPPERLEYTWQWANDPTLSYVTVSIAGAADGAWLEVRHAGLPTPEERENHVMGWNDCLDRLEAYLHGSPSGSD